jgi:imidazolonepropionase-like amidohydrolase
LGELQDEQSREFLIRAEVLSPLEVIRQATLVGAQVVRQEGRLGVIEPGALADLIVLDEDPLRRLEVFLDQGAHIPVVMRDGRFHRNRLS